MATRDLDCTGTESKTNPVLDEAADILSTTGGILLFLGFLGFGGIFGAMATFVFLTGGLPFRSKLSNTLKSDETGHSALSNSDEKGYSDEPDNIVFA
jgi:hypothetical protein